MSEEKTAIEFTNTCTECGKEFLHKSLPSEERRLAEMVAMMCSPCVKINAKPMIALLNMMEENCPKCYSVRVGKKGHAPLWEDPWICGDCGHEYPNYEEFLIFDIEFAGNPAPSVPSSIVVHLHGGGIGLHLHDKEDIGNIRKDSTIHPHTVLTSDQLCSLKNEGKL